VVFLDKQGRVGALVSHPVYPTTEYGGLVFVYMGPPGIEPLFPVYDIIDTRHRDDVVLPGLRLSGDYSVGLVKDCNWLRHYENILDPWHLLWEQIERMEDGLDPMNVTRDCACQHKYPDQRVEHHPVAHGGIRISGG
jgi:hypothetical protein